MPLSQRALAATLGVHEVTVSNWKKLPGFYAEVNRLVDEHLGDDYSEVTDALKREARKGSYQHQKMYFEMIGKYVQKAEIGGPGGGPLRVVVEYVDAADDNPEVA